MDGFSFTVQNVFLIRLFPSIFASDLSLVFYIGETCELSNTLAKSLCKMPCEKDDSCINHGRHTYCPTSPGSSCIMGECLGENLKSNRATRSKCCVSKFQNVMQVECFELCSPELVYIEKNILLWESLVKGTVSSKIVLVHN